MKKGLFHSPEANPGFLVKAKREEERIPRFFAFMSTEGFVLQNTAIETLNRPPVK